MDPKDLPAADWECIGGRWELRPPLACVCPLSTCAQTGGVYLLQVWVTPTPGPSPSTSAQLPMWVSPSELVLWVQAKIRRESLVSSHFLLLAVSDCDFSVQSAKPPGIRRQGTSFLVFRQKALGAVCQGKSICYLCIPHLLFCTMSISSPNRNSPAESGVFVSILPLCDCHNRMVMPWQKNPSRMCKGCVAMAKGSETHRDRACS